MCDVCLKHPCDPRCPNAEPQYEVVEPVDMCDQCGEAIYPGDWYFESETDCVCEKCLNDLPASDVLELCGKSLKMA